MLEQTEIIIPIMLFTGAFIIFFTGFFVGMWLMGWHYLEQEEERQKQQKEYMDYLLNPYKDERTEFNFNGEGK